MRETRRNDDERSMKRGSSVSSITAHGLINGLTLLILLLLFIIYCTSAEFSREFRALDILHTDYTSGVTDEEFAYVCECACVCVHIRAVYILGIVCVFVIVRNDASRSLLDFIRRRSRDLAIQAKSTLFLSVFSFSPFSFLIDSNVTKSGVHYFYGSLFRVILIIIFVYCFFSSSIFCCMMYPRRGSRAFEPDILYFC